VSDSQMFAASAMIRSLLDHARKPAQRRGDKRSNPCRILLSTLAGRVRMRERIDPPRSHGGDRARDIICAQAARQDHRDPRTLDYRPAHRPIVRFTAGPYEGRAFAPESSIR
jgi:hypothetical protein